MLDAAHVLFAERGFGAVTMDDVAAEVGVTKPLLYAYFGNKEQLYIACMRRAGDAMLATVMAAVADAAPGFGALRDGVGAFFGFLGEDRDAWRVLFDETLPAGGAVATAVAEYRARLLALVIGSLLDRAPEHCRASWAIEVEAFANTLFGACEALARWWLRSGAISTAEAAELLVSTIEPGMRERWAAAAARAGAQS